MNEEQALQIAQILWGPQGWAESDQDDSEAVKRSVGVLRPQPDNIGSGLEKYGCGETFWDAFEDAAKRGHVK